MCLSSCSAVVGCECVCVRAHARESACTRESVRESESGCMRESEFVGERVRVCEYQTGRAGRGACVVGERD